MIDGQPYRDIARLQALEFIAKNSPDPAKRGRARALYKELRGPRDVWMEWEQDERDGRAA